MNKVIGILAHVDAGKTTFSEQVLYRAHAIRTLGRVDHQDAFLDFDPMERRRGITIFSGQAFFDLSGDRYWWLDTPGHADFSAEMERALAVMDGAVLVISAAEGVQSHTETLWRLLTDYRVPTMIFLNKTDRPGADPDGTLAAIRRRLTPDAVDIRALQADGTFPEALMEALAERDEPLLERYLAGEVPENGWISALAEAFAARRVFPVMAGSALTGNGVDGFLRLLPALTPVADRSSELFAARVFRVRHDEKGGRLCFLRLDGGTLRVKDTIALPDGGEEKVNELRLYHGSRYESVQAVSAGDLAAIPGLPGLKPGAALGAAEPQTMHVEPMMTADVLYDSAETPAFRLSAALRALEEEDPSLHVQAADGHFSVRVMGRIQLEILQALLRDRYGIPVTFGPFRVLYRETVAAPVIGIGHYEPLRHYAEAHLRLVPGAPGSGIHFRSLCSVNDLSLNWQRLIETHVFEKEHKGVLTGSPLTDVTVELLCGKDHLKHTEGGDFRQATYRAIRNALMFADSVLLEPIAGFSLTVPAETYGGLTGPLAKIKAALDPPVYEGETVTVTGEAPYALFAPWQDDFTALTHGRGLLRVWLSRYAPCHNAAEVIAAAAYNPLADDTPDSVFCSHGAGYNVPWNEVPAHAHLSHEGFV